MVTQKGNRNKKNNAIEHYDRHAVSQICWRMLFHMIGPSEETVKTLNSTVGWNDFRSSNDTFIEIAKLLKKYETEQKTSERSAILNSLVKLLEESLFNPDTNHPKLGKECNRSDNYRKANDGLDNGYSRDPFKEISLIHKPEIALATIAYLVRAHAYFFCRPKIERDFNGAKIALNDLFQSAQLGCRLYYSLQESHLKEYSQQAYIDKVQAGADFNIEPWDSPFFIWWALELVEIWRGNVYRQIGYIHESERYYRHAQERFDRLSKEPLTLSVPHIEIKKGSHTSNTDEYFITSTLVRALFERSKILFDLGLFIESMMNQLRSLAYLKRISDEFDISDSENILMDLTHTLKFLDVVRKQSVWDKEKITSFFGFPRNVSEEIHKITSSIKPERFIASLKKISRYDRELAAEIFDRLAFSLFMLRRSRMPFIRDDKAQKKDFDKEHKDIMDWLCPYLEIYKDLGLDRQPPLAWYTETFLVRKKPLKRKAEVVLEERIERQLAYRLRQSVIGGMQVSPPINEQDFYKAVLDPVTQNIGNIVTIPRQIIGLFMRHGYMYRRAIGDLSHDTLHKSLEQQESSSLDIKRIQNKLVILRRWQSYNPKIPRPLGSKVRGGGYFLLWKGKGIVIDPGYDFIQNFYDEGFSLEDINAIVVTHSHPDHDDDLSTLITLMREWNKYHRKMGYPEEKLLNIDLFLNESTHLKFSDWLKSSKAGIGRVIELPLVVWNADSQKSCERIRGDNVTLKMRKEYNLNLEVVPAWHDDVIGKTAAVGLKFHLYDSKNKVGVVGYTGDTGAYGADSPTKKTESILTIEHQYKDCDVLVAHLGDIRLRELSTIIEKLPDEKKIVYCISELLVDWFYEPEEGQITMRQVTRQRVESFLNFLISLAIAPIDALEAVIEEINGDKITVSNVLYNFIKKKIPNRKKNWTYGQMEDKLISLLPRNCPVFIRTIFHNHMEKAVPLESERENLLEEWQIAFILLGFLCASSLMPWYYPYHLGISGIYRLHRTLVENKKNHNRNKIFIVGELPEELSSYRHHIARLLNATQSAIKKGRTYAFTGDIGMHMSLTIDENRTLDPKIRCTYCNYNNESIKNMTRPHYHRPDKILETSLKRLNAAMIYLCTEHDHHPELEDRTFDFLSSPNIRII